ncbi:MAG: hypothetical protein HZY74_12520 [Brevundimonas sp.]|nr:MAG: hypothetical protein HZY74_12520 [Brevundimonas sp.]
MRGSASADRIVGSAGNDIVLGNGGADNISGGAGDDRLIGGIPGNTGGAPDIIKPRTTLNEGIGAAVSLNGGFDLQARSGVENATTIPHATVLATSSGSLEYYSFTVAAGDTVTFDIDGASLIPRCACLIRLEPSWPRMMMAVRMTAARRQTPC